MTTRLQQRRARLRAEYGFDFPDDLYRFWEFANRLSPLDPLNALAEPLGVALVGPFEVLAGRFDGRVPRHSLLLHWRYHDDPPEFFTALAAGSDGLHWGYFLDDPEAGGGVASYFPRDPYELGVEGAPLFEAVRLHLEYALADWKSEHGLRPDDPAPSHRTLEQIDRVRARLTQYATADRPET